MALIAASATAGTPPTADLRNYLGTRWYGLYFMNQKIGYAEGDISKGFRGGKEAVVVSLTLNARMSMAGQPQQMKILEQRVYRPGEGLVAFTNDTDSGGSAMKIHGEARGGVMEVVSRVGGQERRATVPVPDERFEDYIAEERLAGPDTKVGDQVSFKQYRPELQKTIAATSRVKEIRERLLQGVPTKLYVIETTMPDIGVASTSTIGPEGEVLEAQVGGAFTMRREDEVTAQNGDYRSDVILSTVIRPEKKIQRSTEVREMRALVRGIKDPTLLINSDRQRYAAQPDGSRLLTVMVEDIKGLTVPEIPVARKDMAEALAPTMFIQSDNPAIVERARSIVGNERDAYKAGEKLVRWVHANLRKRFSASFSNALDVLRRGEGDCTEHSVFFVALARAVGLPAREVSGIVYCDEDGGGFFYHQWAEVFVGRWIAVDPTFGQPQADATHVQFASGDLLAQAKILTLVGALDLQVMGVSYGNAR
ncbi:MAG: transglutaminase-like domain-containing protein [Candidatus Aureabacteria bacterium]|nr:transglutaminase-like domain-containing protein [Candidatus Auribacterota bacterium]